MASSSSISDGEGNKESGAGLLILEDLKLRHVNINGKVTRFEALLAVAAISSIKWEEKERKKKVNMPKTQRLLREKALKRSIVLHVKEKGITSKDREFVGEKLLSGAIKFGKELNQKKNVRINISLKRRNPNCEKDENWDTLLENDQERRKRYRKGSSKSKNGIMNGSMPVTPPDLPQEFKEKIKEIHCTDCS